MVVLIDSDVIIEAERGRLELEQWMALRPGDDFLLAAITIAELLYGVERASAQFKIPRQLFLDAVFSALTSLEYTTATARIHARLWAQLEGKGTRIGAHDLIIAATAIEHNAVIATFNQRHFAKIPGLKILKPKIA